MSVFFKYKKNDYVGVVSDEVAKILERKGEGHIVKGRPEPPKPIVPPNNTISTGLTPDKE